VPYGTFPVCILLHHRLKPVAIEIFAADAAASVILDRLFSPFDYPLRDRNTPRVSLTCRVRKRTPARQSRTRPAGSTATRVTKTPALQNEDSILSLQPGSSSCRPTNPYR
jgi:hypothetical protein